MEILISALFIILALILFIVLVFLYKLTIAVGRLDQRLEQFAIHLRDLNLHDLQPADVGMFGEATEVEGDETDAGKSESTPARSRDRRDETQAHAHRPRVNPDTGPFRR